MVRSLTFDPCGFASFEAEADCPGMRMTRRGRPPAGGVFALPLDVQLRRHYPSRPRTTPPAAGPNLS